MSLSTALVIIILSTFPTKVNMKGDGESPFLTPLCQSNQGFGFPFGLGLEIGLGLEDILKPDLLMPLIETLPLEQRLAPYLPEGQWSSEYILELLQSPPFRQQVDSFTYVLRTGQIDLSQFGIDPSKYKFTVLSFLEALEDSVSKTLDPEASRQDDQDSRSQSCNRHDPMDESQ